VVDEVQSAYMSGGLSGIGQATARKGNMMYERNTAGLSGVGENYATMEQKLENRYSTGGLSGVGTVRDEIDTDLNIDRTGGLSGIGEKKTDASKDDNRNMTGGLSGMDDMT
jgi:hypothetical protein